jgi:hypothetical protein
MEQAKNTAIRELAEAPTFQAAKKVAERLEQIGGFDDDRLLEILKACVSDNQIYWISTDDEIASMVARVLVPNLRRLDPQVCERFRELFKPDAEDLAAGGA